jgi:hypothetical protein
MELEDLEQLAKMTLQLSLDELRKYGNLLPQFVPALMTRKKAIEIISLDGVLVGKQEAVVVIVDSSILSAISFQRGPNLSRLVGRQSRLWKKIMAANCEYRRMVPRSKVISRAKRRPHH